MPSITINERDITSPGTLNVTTNTVYIPGYSNMGPVNTPILCETLDVFQSIFGSEPYKFRTAQDWPEATRNTTGVPVTNGGTTTYVGFPANTANTAINTATMGKFYVEHEFEKSYIMATELLKLGLPVLYERKLAKDDIADWTSTATISSGSNIVVTLKSAFPGKITEKIYYTLKKNETNITANTKGIYYTLTVGMDRDDDLGTSDISPVVTNFTFDG
jgi:hypothetical protein